MVPTANIQSVFLEEIRKRLPHNISLADDLSDALHISRDSAYRRIRGETILSLDEAKVLCNHYGISLDSLFSSSSNTVTFRYQPIEVNTFGFESWFKSILSNLEMIHASKEKELIYSAKDVPIFYHFDFPELTAFKIYFWNKTVLGSNFLDQKFKPNLISNELLALAKRIWYKYAALPSTELWSDETINITLRQIEFTYDCGFFEKPEDARYLVDQFSSMLNNIRKWAERGVKNATGEKFRLYKNEILIADNTIFFKMESKRIVFLTQNSMEYIATSQENFCRQTENSLSNLVNKSVLISTTGEKERNRFFNAMNEKIDVFRSKIR